MASLLRKMHRHLTTEAAVQHELLSGSKQTVMSNTLYSLVRSSLGAPILNRMPSSTIRVVPAATGAVLQVLPWFYSVAYGWSAPPSRTGRVNLYGTLRQCLMVLLAPAPIGCISRYHR